MNRSHQTRSVRLLLALATLISVARTVNSQESQSTSPSKTTLKSPDGRLAISFEIAVPSASDSKASAEKIDKSPRLVYFVTFKDKPVIDASALRLELADKPALGPNLHIV